MWHFFQRFRQKIVLSKKKNHSYSTTSVILNVLHYEAEVKSEVNDHGPSADIHKQI